MLDGLCPDCLHLVRDRVCVSPALTSLWSRVCKSTPPPPHTTTTAVLRWDDGKQQLRRADKARMSPTDCVGQPLPVEAARWMRWGDPNCRLSAVLAGRDGTLDPPPDAVQAVTMYLLGAVMGGRAAQGLEEAETHCVPRVLAQALVHAVGTDVERMMEPVPLSCRALIEALRPSHLDLLFQCHHEGGVRLTQRLREGLLQLYGRHLRAYYYPR